MEATGPPAWGEASDLIELLDVRPDGAGRFVSVVRGDASRPVVEGSQMLGQAIVAAGRHVPGRRPVSVHMMFLRAADATAPLAFELEELQSGRTFTALLVHVRQGERRCASGTMLLDVTSGDVMRHAVPIDVSTGPDEARPVDMGVNGREVRIAEGIYRQDPDAPIGPPVIDAWVRYDSVPDDPLLHAGLVAQFTGRLSIASAMRPHAGVGQAQAHRTLSTAVNAIALSLHADVRADRWMHYRHHATFAGDGMTHAECRVHAESGALIASFTVDAMVRRLDDPAATGSRPVL